MNSRGQGGALAKVGAAAVLAASVILTGGRGPGGGWFAKGWPDAARGAYVAPNDTVAKGKHGVVVTQEPHATAVGLEVLRKGGNAVDAAVAVALTLAVTFPQAGNLGGGGFMVLRRPDGLVSTIDFRERAPKSATRDMYLSPDGSVDNDKVQLSVTAAGVPGSPAGLLYALQKFGTKNMADVAKPAIRLAQEGFAIDRHLARSLSGKKRQLARFEATRAVFFAGENPLEQGDLLVQADLASTLQRFADRGLKGFYEGETADLIAAHMTAGGGFVTLEDLKAYEPRERDALRVNYRGYEVISMGPPSSGGVAMLQMLNMLSAHDVKKSGYGSSEYIHLLTEVMRRAYADRSRWLGDPDFYKVPVAGLISAKYAKKLGKTIDLEKVSVVAPGVPPGAKESDDTTHFSIIDKDGYAVSCTTTINSTFGSCSLCDGAGFFWNNEMDDFSAKPGVPNQFGLVGGKANEIAPGKRMLSSMTPTIICKDGKLRYVLGAPGGGRIITGVMQVLLNAIDHGMPLTRAVMAPRIHHQWKPDQIQWEALALPRDVRKSLIERGHKIAGTWRGIAQVFAAQVLPDGTRIGVADHRSGGAAAAY